MAPSHYTDILREVAARRAAHGRFLKDAKDAAVDVVEANPSDVNDDSQQGLAASLMDLPRDVLVEVAARLSAQDLASFLSTARSIWKLQRSPELLALWAWHQRLTAPDNTMKRMIDRSSCQSSFINCLKAAAGSGISLWHPRPAPATVTTHIVQWAAKNGCVDTLTWAFCLRDEQAFQLCSTSQAATCCTPHMLPDMGSRASGAPTACILHACQPIKSLERPDGSLLEPAATQGLGTAWPQQAAAQQQDEVQLSLVEPERNMMVQSMPVAAVSQASSLSNHSSMCTMHSSSSLSCSTHPHSSPISMSQCSASDQADGTANSSGGSSSSSSSSGDTLSMGPSAQAQQPTALGMQDAEHHAGDALGCIVLSVGPSSLLTAAQLRAQIMPPSYREALSAGLLTATAHARLDILRLLIDEAGANVHAEHDRALRWACIVGRADVVELLLSRGANVHALGGFAFEVAAMHSHKAVMQLLEEHRSKPLPL